MLVLTVKIGEKLCIGDDTQLIVTKRTDYQVSIGINAPRHVNIVRKELLTRQKDATKV